MANTQGHLVSLGKRVLGFSTSSSNCCATPAVATAATGREEKVPAVKTMGQLPVAVIGGGPVGLAAAAHLAERQHPFVLLEAGQEIGAGVRAWGHVRVFSPWRYNVDQAARRLLDSAGWQAPDNDALPTGDELVDRYLAPLADHPAIAPGIRLNARVTAIGRKEFDKVRTKGRDQQPFEIHLEGGEIVEARAVIDASGTWGHPNPMGPGGFPVPGEREFADHVSYGIPNVLSRDRARFAGKRVMVVGSGHSAINVALDLLALVEQVPGTEVSWAIRRENLSTVFGGGWADALPARGELGERAKRAVEARQLRVLSPYRIRSIARVGAAVEVTGVLNVTCTRRRPTRSWWPPASGPTSTC